jgi:hypothetical protein
MVRGERECSQCGDVEEVYQPSAWLSNSKMAASLESESMDG